MTRQPIDRKPSATLHVAAALPLAGFVVAALVAAIVGLTHSEPASSTSRLVVLNILQNQEKHPVNYYQAIQDVETAIAVEKFSVPRGPRVHVLSTTKNHGNYFFTVSTSSRTSPRECVAYFPGVRHWYAHQGGC